MKNVFATLLVAFVGIGIAACEGSASDADVDQSQGAASARCGEQETGPKSLLTAVETMDGSVFKLITAPRDASSIPTGARQPIYFTSIDLRKTGKFSAKYNTGTKLTGTYSVAKPSRAKNYTILTLDPAGEEAEGLTFKVFHKSGSDFTLPEGAFGFIGDGFTPFNMKTNGVEEATPAPTCDCDSLPRPRCPGAYACEQGECVWTARAGARCGGPI